MAPIEVFCCYARRDKPLLDDLRNHLKILERQGLITIWNDTDISPGSDWEDEVEKHLNTAHIILLLISSDFVASDYCYSKEMKRAIERHERGEARVIPVILRPGYWHGAPFTRLHALPSGAKPVISSSWHSQDEALLDVVKGIREAIKSIQETFSRQYTSFSTYASHEVKRGRPIGEVLTEYSPGLDILFKSIMDAAKTRIVEVIKKGKPAGKALKDCSPSLEKIFRDVGSISTLEPNIDVEGLQAQIENLLQEVSAVGDGDLRVQAEVTPDTLGVLADSFNYMIEELAKVVIHIQMTTAKVIGETSEISEAIKAQQFALETIARLAEEFRKLPGSTPDSARHIVRKVGQLNTFMTEGSKRLESIKGAMDVLYESVSHFRLPQIDLDEQERIGNEAE
jgi:hypothetical protein